MVAVVIVIWDMTGIRLAGGFDAERVAPDLGAVDGARDARGLGGRHLGQREALEHAHVPHRLAVEPRERGDGVG